MIKNIIFDIGNVLSDFCWKEMMIAKGCDETMAERIADASVRTDLWYELDRGVWADEQLLDAFVQNAPEIETQIRTVFADLHGMVRPRDYAIPWVKELKAKGYNVYYLSNFSRRAEVQCPESLGFIKYTDGGILSYTERIVKPDAEIYLLLLERFGLKAEESVFLDDTLRNIQAAENLGIHGIWFQSKEQAEEELRKLGVE
ncbi:MAG: HAD family phosphatase [Lachnospiraceae bacterium]|nr:HAD family phosphatase [Lachnospiraceae bacterium]